MGLTYVNMLKDGNSIEKWQLPTIISSSCHACLFNMALDANRAGEADELSGAGRPPDIDGTNSGSFIMGTHQEEARDVQELSVASRSWFVGVSLGAGNENPVQGRRSTSFHFQLHFEPVVSWIWRYIWPLGGAAGPMLPKYLFKQWHWNSDIFRSCFQDSLSRSTPTIEPVSFPSLKPAHRVFRLVNGKYWTLKK